LFGGRLLEHPRHLDSLSSAPLDWPPPKAEGWTCITAKLFTICMATRCRSNPSTHLLVPMPLHHTRLRVPFSGNTHARWPVCIRCVTSLADDGGRNVCRLPHLPSALLAASPACRTAPLPCAPFYPPHPRPTMAQRVGRSRGNAGVGRGGGWLLVVLLSTNHACMNACDDVRWHLLLIWRLPFYSNVGGATRGGRDGTEAFTACAVLTAVCCCGLGSCLPFILNLRGDCGDAAADKAGNVPLTAWRGGGGARHAANTFCYTMFLSPPAYYPSPTPAATCCAQHGGGSTGLARTTNAGSLSRPWRQFPRAQCCKRLYWRQRFPLLLAPRQHKSGRFERVAPSCYLTYTTRPLDSLFSFRTHTRRRTCARGA